MITTEDKKKEFLKNEITAFEMRLDTAKTEIAGLSKRKEALLKSMEEARSAFDSDVETRNNVTRTVAQGVADERKKLEEDKLAFQAVLAAYKKERVDFERERQEALDIKSNYTKMAERVSRFIAVVNRESPLL